MKKGILIINGILCLALAILSMVSFVNIIRQLVAIGAMDYFLVLDLYPALRDSICVVFYLILMIFSFKGAVNKGYMFFSAFLLGLSLGSTVYSIYLIPQYRNWMTWMHIIDIAFIIVQMIVFIQYRCNRGRGVLKVFSLLSVAALFGFSYTTNQLAVTDTYINSGASNTLLNSIYSSILLIFAFILVIVAAKLDYAKRRISVLALIASLSMFIFYSTLYNGDGTLKAFFTTFFLLCFGGSLLSLFANYKPKKESLESYKVEVYQSNSIEDSGFELGDKLDEEKEAKDSGFEEDSSLGSKKNRSNYVNEFLGIDEEEKKEELSFSEKADRLLKLKSQRDSGAITEEDYQKAKEELIGGLD